MIIADDGDRLKNLVELGALFFKLWVLVTIAFLKDVCTILAKIRHTLRQPINVNPENLA